MTRTTEQSQNKASVAIVTLPMPENRHGRHEPSPLAQAIIAMAADPDKALIYVRTADENIRTISIKMGGARRCATFRYPDRKYELRKIEYRGHETYAVWRIK
jgi:hypothetical protein